MCTCSSAGGEAFILLILLVNRVTAFVPDFHFHDAVRRRLAIVFGRYLIVMGLSFVKDWDGMSADNVNGGVASAGA